MPSWMCNRTNTNKQRIHSIYKRSRFFGLLFLMSIWTQCSGGATSLEPRPTRWNALRWSPWFYLWEVFQWFRHSCRFSNWAARSGTGARWWCWEKPSPRAATGNTSASPPTWPWTPAQGTSTSQTDTATPGSWSFPLMANTSRSGEQVNEYDLKLDYSKPFTTLTSSCFPTMFSCFPTMLQGRRTGGDGSRSASPTAWRSCRTAGSCAWPTGRTDASSASWPTRGSSWRRSRRRSLGERCTPSPTVHTMVRSSGIQTPFVYVVVLLLLMYVYMYLFVLFIGIIIIIISLCINEWMNNE